MSSEQLTSLLSILLIVSLVILFVLIIVFIAIALSNKLKESKQGENEKNKKQNGSNDLQTSSVIQTKAYTTENIKKLMDFDDITDNMIIRENGKKYVMVIKCNGINYDLMSGMENVAVESGFIQFLNSLVNPIQIYVQARKVNLEDSVINYKKRLKTIEASFNRIKIQYEQAQRDSEISEQQYKNIRFEYLRQKNLYEYTKDIISNTEKMSLNRNILTKNYYIAISYYPDNKEELFNKDEISDMAFSDLYTNAQSILRTISICGITGKVLNSEELADLLYVAYNRDASEIYGIDKAIKAGYDSLYTTAPDVFEKKIKELDKVIDERALDVANDAIDSAVLKSKKQKEVELKEKEFNDLVMQMARQYIKENKKYIKPDVAEEALKELDRKQTKKQKKGA